MNGMDRRHARRTLKTIQCAYVIVGFERKPILSIVWVMQRIELEDVDQGARKQSGRAAASSVRAWKPYGSVTHPLRYSMTGSSSIIRIASSDVASRSPSALIRRYVSVVVTLSAHIARIKGDSRTTCCPLHDYNWHKKRGRRRDTAICTKPHPRRSAVTTS